MERFRLDYSCNMFDRLQKNLSEVRREIASACASSGRNVDDVTLVCVTKYAQIDWVHGLYALGERDFGESRPQQLSERTALLADDVRWHLIGTLQANKVRPAVRHASTIHSVDSLKLLERVERIAIEENACPQLFLQVNVSGEAAKHGWSPQSFRNDAARLPQSSQARIVGLMTMAPAVDRAGEARPYFTALKALRDEVGPAWPALSMGMSGDFCEAIEEGATHIRVGSRLFEGL